MLYIFAIYRNTYSYFNLNLIVIVFLSFFNLVNIYYAIALYKSINLKIVKYIYFLVVNKRS